jgi:hypothetical protein
LKKTAALRKLTKAQSGFYLKFKYSRYKTAQKLKKAIYSSQKRKLKEKTTNTLPKILVKVNLHKNKQLISISTIKYKLSCRSNQK